MGIIDRKQLRRRISLMLGVSKSIYWGPTRPLMSVGDGGDVMKKYLDFQFSDNFVTPYLRLMDLCDVLFMYDCR